MASAADIGMDDPLRLDRAAAIAFRDGTMTASGLRLEAKRGRLVIERVAGKDYTTLAHIKRMRELCRLEAKAQDCISATSGATETPDASPILPSGSSAMGHIQKAHDACQTIVSALKSSSKATSPESTSMKPHANNVVRLKSRSRTC